MSALSAVVMVSAFLILYFQADAWQAAFQFNEATGMYERAAGAQFTNGFRYLNWLIDVPLLLIQMLFVLALTAAKRWKYGVQFVVSGALMIILGYIGQFYEVTSAKALIIWGILSTVFFIHILVLMYKIIFEGIKDNTMPAGAKRIMKHIWCLFVVMWLLYPIAYAMPLLSWTSDAVVLRQVLFTIADIGSKVIYGILLLQVAIARSQKEKYVVA